MKKKTKTWIVSSSLALLLGAGAVLAGDGPADRENWPQFRGPLSTGLAPSTEGRNDPRLPERWSATENVAWKTEIPGVGWSSPIVWDDRIYLTSVISLQEKEAPKKGLYFGGERPAPKDEHRWMVYAVDWKTGKIIWEKEAYRDRKSVV